MISDLQKASLLKRASAFLLDVILLAVLVTGLAFLISTATGYDGYTQQMNDIEKEYEARFDVSFDLTEQAYNELTEEQKAQVNKAYAAYTADERVVYAYDMMVSLILLTTSLSILGAYLVLEFILPLVFGNGQTVGKKIFGIGLMHIEGVRITGKQVFIRSVLGKYSVELMLPIYILIMTFTGGLGMVGWVLLASLLLAQIVCLIITRTNAPIHDIFASTVAVDLISQRIFEDIEDRDNYIKAIHAERAARADY